MMDRAQIEALLDRRQVDYHVAEHPAALTIGDMQKFHLDGSEGIVKNLFLRDDKKKNYYLVVVRQEKTVNLKALRRELGTRPLSFASEADLERRLGLHKGEVTPMGILNDTDRVVQVVFDKDVLEQDRLGVHPNTNTATLFLAPAELWALLEEHGNSLVTARIEQGA